ncbi:MAG: hypothetical protein FWD12_12940, partial [Alphaproteobacteria bacterium]|nr:hypothetical protein [Alphaproteobacteria bacterium]
EFMPPAIRGRYVTMLSALTNLAVVATGFVAIAFALYIPELFPTPLRLRGVAVVGSVGRLAGAGVQFAVAATFSTLGIIGVATGLVCALLIQAAAVLLLGPETSERSLEDIARRGRLRDPAR